MKQEHLFTCYGKSFKIISFSSSVLTPAILTTNHFSISDVFLAKDADEYICGW